MKYSEISQNPDVVVIQVSEYICHNIDIFYPKGNISSGDARKLSTLLDIIEAALEAGSYDNHYGIGGIFREARQNDQNKTAFARSITDFYSLAAKIYYERTFSTPQSGDPVFELDGDDRVRVMELISQIRGIVAVSEFLDDPHRVRILRRLASLEREVFKEKGNFDVVLGAIVDVGEALGRFGEKAKPIADRVKEIRTITQRKTEEYEALPDSSETPKKIEGPREG